MNWRQRNGGDGSATFCVAGLVFNLDVFQLGSMNFSLSNRKSLFPFFSDLIPSASCYIKVLLSPEKEHSRQPI
ncbi:hypothetical protein L596_020394 [Steinernema carpocapsae]|uniref:Uncharacterized protein n=1 Tax=Steinernema carpocapsae TaxID=34508 RepID=A0A4U5MTL3_STECR|nr:hypothetical protein L596_020394 [Steinernema carpocapsae]